VAKVLKESGLSDPRQRITDALADRYRIERELGAGGMATVYLAEDLRHHRRVALKVLRPDLAATVGPERFLREVTIAANLQHLHILPVHDSGESGGFLYYVMPFVEGHSLRERLVKQGELPVPEVARILREVADAMAAAHAKGVVHRDIKPENILLSGRHAVVTDFGVAKAVSEATGRSQLTTAGVALGTPTYMAPEQAAADPHMDHRVDIYALGVMGYEMLTGRPPFVGPTPQSVLAAHVTTAAEPPTKYRATIPAGMAELVMRCLEKKPADRPQTAEELLPVLESLATPSGGITPTSTRPMTAVQGRSLMSKWQLWGAVAAVVAVAAVAATLRRPSLGRVAAVAGEPTVAVLYFENLTRDTSAQYLADGLTEDVTNSLGEVKRVQVKVPSAVRRVQRANAGNVGAIGKALGVRYLLEGSIRQTPAGVRVAVRLVDHAAETAVWSKTFDRSTEQVLVLPAEIALEAGNALVGELGVEEQTAVATRPTKVPGAYDAYLRRRFLPGPANRGRQSAGSSGVRACGEARPVVRGREGGCLDGPHPIGGLRVVVRLRRDTVGCDDRHRLGSCVLGRHSGSSVRHAVVGASVRPLNRRATPVGRGARRRAAGGAARSNEH
jgi:serine/threonine-protein kinase